MRALLGTIVSFTLTVGYMLVGVPQAFAGCGGGTYKFTLESKPSIAEEGSSIRITVGMDGAVDDDPESIHVETVDGSAKAGQDYTGIPKTRVTLKKSKSSEEFTISIISDSAPEPAETFAVRLSDPPNCASNVYVVQEPITVTIAANQSGSPASPPNAGTSPSNSVDAAAAGTTARGSPSPGAIHLDNLSDPIAAESTQSPSAPIEAKGKSGGGNKGATFVVIIIAALFAVAVGFVLWRLRGI